MVIGSDRMEGSFVHMASLDYDDDGEDRGEGNSQTGGFIVSWSCEY